MAQFNVYRAEQPETLGLLQFEAILIKSFDRETAEFGRRIPDGTDKALLSMQTIELLPYLFVTSGQLKFVYRDFKISVFRFESCQPNVLGGPHRTLDSLA